MHWQAAPLRSRTFLCVCLSVNIVYVLDFLGMHMSYHPCQLGVPAVLLDREPVVGGALLAEGLQTRRKQCCRGFPSAPPVQPRRELLGQHRGRQTSPSGLWNIKSTIFFLQLHGVTYQEPGPHSDQKRRWHSCWPRPGFLTGRRPTCWLRWPEWPVSLWGLLRPLCLRVHPLILDTVTENLKNQPNEKDATRVVC